MLRLTLSLAILLFTSASYSAEATISDASQVKVFTFAQWKSQQVNDAENRAARLSNRVMMAKSESRRKAEISSLESETRVAKQNIEIVKDLSIEDYVNIYLSQFTDDEGVLNEVAKSLTKDEVTNLLKALLRAKSTSASLENSAPLFSGLTVKSPLPRNL